MPIPAVVKDLNAVDEALRPLYVEKNDRYVLDVKPEDGFALEDIKGLTSALGAERHTRSELEAKLRDYADLDPRAARDALAKVTELADLDPVKAREAIATAERLLKIDPEKEADRLAEVKFNNSKSQLTTQFERRETELTGEVKTLKEVLTRREAQVEKLLKENVIKNELSKHNPLKDATDVLERIIADNVKMREVNGQYIVEVVDDKGVPRIKDYTGTPFSVSDYVAEIREARASLFQPDNKHGADLTPQKSPAKSSSDNPWIAGPNFSFTNQMILIKTDPQLAARLKAEAGVR